MSTHRSATRTQATQARGVLVCLLASMLASMLASTLACSGSTPATAPARDARGQTATAPPVPTATQLLTAGQAVVRRGVLIAQAVRKNLEEARRDVDIIKITCLDDKRTEIDVNLRTAEARLGALQRASDGERRAHEHTVLSVLDGRLQTLGDEAGQCLGQALYDTGEQRLVAEIDPRVMPFEETASQPPVVESPSVTPPPPAFAP